MFLDLSFRFFFFNDTATTEIYTLSLHDALPISCSERFRAMGRSGGHGADPAPFDTYSYGALEERDRKSTRLNSSHGSISYAVFCLKKKKKQNNKKNTRLEDMKRTQ